MNLHHALIMLAFNFIKFVLMKNVFELFHDKDGRTGQSTTSSIPSTLLKKVY
jgi:hypothetical protein